MSKKKFAEQPGAWGCDDVSICLHVTKYGKCPKWIPGRAWLKLLVGFRIIDLWCRSRKRCILCSGYGALVVRLFVVCLYECFGGTDCHYLQGQGEVGSMSQHVDPSQNTRIRIEIKSIKSKLDPWTCLLCLKLRNSSQYKDRRVSRNVRAHSRPNDMS